MSLRKFSCHATFSGVAGYSLPLPSAVARARAEPPFPYLRWLGSQRQAGRLWTGRPALFWAALHVWQHSMVGGRLRPRAAPRHAAVDAIRASASSRASAAQFIAPCRLPGRPTPARAARPHLRLSTSAEVNVDSGAHSGLNRALERHGSSSDQLGPTIAVAKSGGRHRVCRCRPTREPPATHP